MQIKLRGLFVLVAIAAAVSAWWAQRTTPLPFNTLIQIVNAHATWPAQSAAPTAASPKVPSINDRNMEFENAFYALLSKKLTDEHPDTLKGMSDPAAELREVLRCELVLTVGNSPLYNVTVWGTAFSDRQRLETMMKAAIEVVGIISQDQSLTFRTKILSTSSP